MNYISKLILLTLLLSAHLVYSQDNSGATSDVDTVDDYAEEESNITFGLHIGSLLANQHTASLYDGYGYDIDGNKNNFFDSWLYQKVWEQYGGNLYGGQQDQIALALNVDPGTWSFNETFMPGNMRYSPAICVGITSKYSVDRDNAILLNVNAAKLTATGNFKIKTTPSNTGSSTNITDDSNKLFPIIGEEQRLQLQIGLQHIFGEDKKYSALIEGGLHATLAKFSKNYVQINNLTIDLMEYYNNVFNTANPIRMPIGIGFGAFGSVGLNANLNPKTIVQLIYSPILVRINMGDNKQFKLQNAIAIRFYFDLFGNDKEDTGLDDALLNDEPIINNESDN